MNAVLTQLAAGTATGSQYALVALGFVVIYKATGVINLAQGGLLMLGAYLTYNASTTWGLPFSVALLIGVGGGALVGALIETAVLRPMRNQPIFAVILITFGLFIVIQEVVASIWGTENLVLLAPWADDPVHDVVRLGDVVVPYEDIATVALAAVALLGFYVLFRHTRMGLAMRATALDPQAALAQGISSRRVNALSWAIAGAVGALAGVTAADGPAPSLAPTLGAVALVAFPVTILGGLDSPGGAVVAGLIIGVTQALTQGWETGAISFSWLPTYPEWLGHGFNDVMPYFVMVVVLLVRPYGLFGTRKVVRA